jgi:hypothetical protein
LIDEKLYLWFDPSNQFVEIVTDDILKYACTSVRKLQKYLGSFLLDESGDVFEIIEINKDISAKRDFFFFITGGRNIKVELIKVEFSFDDLKNQIRNFDNPKYYFWNTEDVTFDGIWDNYIDELGRCYTVSDYLNMYRVNGNLDVLDIMC